MKESKQQFCQIGLINHWWIHHYHKCKVEDNYLEVMQIVLLTRESTK